MTTFGSYDASQVSREQALERALSDMQIEVQGNLDGVVATCSLQMHWARVATTVAEEETKKTIRQNVDLTAEAADLTLALATSEKRATDATVELRKVRAELANVTSHKTKKLSAKRLADEICISTAQKERIAELTTELAEIKKLRIKETVADIPENPQVLSAVRGWIEWNMRTIWIELKKCEADPTVSLIQFTMLTVSMVNAWAGGVLDKAVRHKT